MNRVLVLGTGNAQKDLIEYCKANDYEVIAASNSKKSPISDLADEFHQIDITDSESILALAEKKKIDCVYSVGSDVAMPTIAKTSESLKLPCFFSFEAANTCNHKYMLREALERNHISGNIPYQIMESPDDPIRVPFPAIMKPSDSQGQRGVRKVNNQSELRRFFSETLSFSREKKVILESFIDGDEISVNVFLQDGEIRLYLISDRKVWDEYPGGIIREHLIPSRYEKDPDVSAKIRDLVTDVLAAIHLENGPAYFQIKISPEGRPYLIEVTPRLDGCHMWRLIRYCTGVDLLRASMELLEGKGYHQPAPGRPVPCSLEFFCGKPGTVFSKRNYTVPENEFLCWYYEDGQTVLPMNGYFEKCGYMIRYRLS